MAIWLYFLSSAIASAANEILAVLWNGDSFPLLPLFFPCGWCWIILHVLVISIRSLGFTTLANHNHHIIVNASIIVIVSIRLTRSFLINAVFVGGFATTPRLYLCPLLSERACCCWWNGDSLLFGPRLLCCSGRRLFGTRLVVLTDKVRDDEDKLYHPIVWYIVAWAYFCNQ